ncbi:Uncharacterized protein BP5553_04942 [Venustampulla echinocandica]|uniref:Protein kinase domain-containing protein n=1 Tax=Venustampulla echinocandica TaxID=2656787 RepID=A0A370TPS0_9HELO|nr:Uncharacterized protein BP5553_04942 [Venustampulla echinocandica]RDL37509.1 Uncharacterized protein BP5553_04942 [Venustampulla echinocandica]
MAWPQEILAAAEDKDFKLAGCGLFAQVLVLIESGIALKICDEPGEASEVEKKKIYERLGRHPQILTSYGKCESKAGKGLTLEYLPAGLVVRHLAQEKYLEERKEWPAQAINAVTYVHSKGVIHGDIGAHNFLVSKDGSVVLADFCGSSLDGSTAAVAPSIRYSRPISMEERLLNIRVRDDLFALGAVLYEIAVGSRIWESKDDRNVTKLYETGELPDLQGIEARLARVIKKCWKDQYESADEIQANYAQLDDGLNVEE